MEIKNFNTFKPLDGSPKERKVASFDIEGGGAPDNFVCGAVCADGGTTFYTDNDDMRAHILKLAHQGYWVFSHNLDYDLPLLDGAAFPRGTVTYTKRGVLSARYPYGKREVRLFDSMNLFPRQSVQALGECVGLPKHELGPDTLQKLQSGARLSDFHPANQVAIRAYCERDAQIVHDAVLGLQEILLELGGKLRPTISGSAMDVFRRAFQEQSWLALGPEANKLARQAAYGGRTEAFMFGVVPHCNKYDINSLYPSVMKETRFPDTWFLRLATPARGDHSWLQWEGVVHGTLEVPESYLPPLPYRSNKRLFFPYGRLKGAWPIVELRQALEYGVKLLGVDWVIGSPYSFDPFERFVDLLWEKRSGYLSEGSRKANWLKLLLNSLFGRFGLNPEDGLRSLMEIKSKEDLERCQGSPTWQYGSRLMALAQQQAHVFPSYVNLILFSQITGAARARLYRELFAQSDGLAYCDTDSVITLGELSEGDGLGEWRSEMLDGTADILSPKAYALAQEYEDWDYRVKGVPAILAESYFKGQQVRWQRAIGGLEAIRDNRLPTEWVEMFRLNQGVAPKRLPLGEVSSGAGGPVTSWPWAVEELPWLTGQTAYWEKMPEAALERIHLKVSQLQQRRLL